MSKRRPPTLIRRSGPKSPAGKQRVDLNRVTHGLDAVRQFLLEDEDGATFEKYRAAYVRALAPKGAFEADTADRAAYAAWCWWRAGRFMIKALKHAMAGDGNADQILSPHWPEGLAGEALRKALIVAEAEEGRQLAAVMLRYSRYQQRCEGTIYRALAAINGANSNGFPRLIPPDAASEQDGETNGGRAASSDDK